MKLSVILLAAGLSARMGEDKLLMEMGKKTLLQIAVDILDEIKAFEKIIVTSKQRLNKITLPNEIKAIINTDPGRGQSSSIKLGLSNTSGTHYLFMAADQPLLGLSDVEQITDAARLNPDKIIYPQIDSKPGMPAIFPGAFRDELLALTGDTGGRVLRDKYPEKCLIIKPKHPGNFKDIDTIGEYHAFS